MFTLLWYVIDELQLTNCALFEILAMISCRHARGTIKG